MALPGVRRHARSPIHVVTQVCRSLVLDLIARQQSTSMVWVGLRSGTVLQMDTAGKNAGRPFSMRVLYSDINSPAIRIAAPK